MAGHSPSGNAPFDPAKLARIQASLEHQGVTFLIGPDGAALARAVGAAALYMPAEPDRPGIIVLGDAPSCAAVIEELIHLGQHRRLRWQDVGERIPELEVIAQDRLLRLGARWGWPAAELDRFRQVRERWRARIGP